MSSQERIAAIMKRMVTSRWFAPAVLLLLTLLYFLPIVIRLGVYIPGGDAMYNAWVMERNQHCILREHCPVYTDANIYYPNKDTMLYSEVEISPSIATMPIHLVNDNPIIAYNIVTIASFFAAGMSMYMLARYLSKGSILFSLVGGIIFEFSPIMLASTHHLQNLSVFCMPLAIFLILKYLDTRTRRYLVFLLLTLLYVFFASWYQMIFTSMLVGLLMIGLLIIDRKNFKPLVMVGVVLAIAIVCTLPLAKEYLRFSHSNGAKYSFEEKVANSTSLIDYIVPPNHTLTGKIYRLNPDSVNAFNPDTLSYSGISLAIVVGAGLVLLLMRPRPFADASAKLYILLVAVGVIGFLISLGPLLKVQGEFVYMIADTGVSLPMPWFLVDQYVPALGFMRGVGRASVLLIIASCALLAMLAHQANKYKFYTKHRSIINTLVVVCILADLLPLRMVDLSPLPQAYHHGIPPVYQYIKEHKDIDNIIILQAKDYPNVDFWFARTEQVLWSGYFNRNLYTGYSGYVPPTYEAEYSDFVNLDADDPAQMRKRGLQYVVVDTELYINKPEVLKKVPSILGTQPVYSDSRYKMFKL